MDITPNLPEYHPNVLPVPPGILYATTGLSVVFVFCLIFHVATVIFGLLLNISLLRGLRSIGQAQASKPRRTVRNRPTYTSKTNNGNEPQPQDQPQAPITVNMLTDELYAAVSYVSLLCAVFATPIDGLWIILGCEKVSSITPYLIRICVTFSTFFIVCLLTCIAFIRLWGLFRSVRLRSGGATAAYNTSLLADSSSKRSVLGACVGFSLFFTIIWCILQLDGQSSYIAGNDPFYSCESAARSHEWRKPADFLKVSQLVSLMIYAVFLIVNATTIFTTLAIIYHHPVYKYLRAAKLRRRTLKGSIPQLMAIALIVASLLEQYVSVYATESWTLNGNQFLGIRHLEVTLMLFIVGLCYPFLIVWSYPRLRRKLSWWNCCCVVKSPGNQDHSTLTHWQVPPATEGPPTSSEVEYIPPEDLPRLGYYSLNNLGPRATVHSFQDDGYLSSSSDSDCVFSRPT